MIKRMFKTIVESTQKEKLLGRWNLDYNYNTVKRKVDFANEDHCFCDEYISKKRKKHNNNKHKL